MRADLIENALTVVEVAIIGAVTPGPNNAAVMRAAVSGGVRQALASIHGVIVGSLLLAGLTLAGLCTLFRMVPAFGSILTALSVAYLAWLGISMVVAASSATQPDPGTRGQDLPSGCIGLAAFQLVNPKAWGLMTTLVSVMHSDNGLSEAALFLGAISVLVPAVCLGFWAVLGLTISRHLKHPKLRISFDVTMGALLIMTAAALLAKTRL